MKQAMFKTRLCYQLLIALGFAACSNSDTVLSPPASPETTERMVETLTTISPTSTMPSESLATSTDQPQMMAELPEGFYFTKFEMTNTDTGNGITSLWIVNAGGEPELRFQKEERFRLALDPSGERALIWGQESLGILDVQTGNIQPLPQLPDQLNGQLIWWPAHPDTVIAGSIPANRPELGIDGAFGYLTFIGLDGTYELTEEYLYAAPEPLPDGLLYARVGIGPTGNPSMPDPANGLFIRHTDGTVEPFQGIELDDTAWIGDISASKDGNLIGLAIMDDYSTHPPRASIGVLDWKTGTYRIIDQYQPMGLGGALLNSAPQWGPSNELFAYYKLAGPAEQAGIWAVENWGAPRMLTIPHDRDWGKGSPQFSPDGKWIAAFIPGGTIGFIDTETWKVHVWEEMVASIGWIGP